jgi:RHS repeat-associated protein
MPSRTWDNLKYRYGFNGQEKDKLLNTYSHKFRELDLYTGRFWSVDPLYRKYPWNSTYAFAENDVIRSVDLEGLERYFTIQGKYLGQVGKSNQMRIVNQSDVKTFLDFRKSNLENSKPSVFGASKPFHEVGLDIQSNITQNIYTTSINKGGKLDKIKQDLSDDGTGMSMVLGKAELTLYPNAQKNGEFILDDYFNFINLLYHEDYLRKGYGDEAHFSIAEKQTKHWSFESMSDAGKSFLKDVMRSYLREDFEDNINQMLFNQGSKERAIELTKTDLFQKFYKAYKTNAEYFNKFWKENRKILNYNDRINELFKEKE